MYVTLEPCAHSGKQPPCTAAILDQGIRTVYVGSMDPNPKVNGRGVWTLRQHGVEVVTGCIFAIPLFSRSSAICSLGRGVILSIMLQGKLTLLSSLT